MTLSIPKRPRFIAQLATVALFCAATLGAVAQTVTGAFTPATVAPSTASSLALSYAAFTSNSSGMNLRVYYNSAALTLGTVTYNNPPGSSQSASVSVAGTLASCAGANQYITLNWADINGTWPTPVAGSLATVPVTTTAAFAAPTLVCWEDDIDNGAVERNITGSATLSPIVAAVPSVSVAASPATLVDAAANVATVTFTASAAAPAGGLSVAFTPPTAGGLIASTTCTSPIAIAAGNTTATCTVTAAVNTVPGDGPTVGTTTVIAGTGYTVGAPASATVTVNNDDVAPGTPVVTIAAAPATLVDAAGNVATVTVTSSLVAPATGLVVNLTPAAANARYTTTCGATVTIAAGATTATCTVTAVANTTVGDGNVTATTTLAAPSASYTLGATTSAAVAVNDNDLPAAITPVTPAGALLLPSYAPGATPGRSTTALNFNVTGGAGALACVAAGAGYTATPNPLNLVVGTAGTVTVTYTGTAAGTFTGTLTCTSTAPATGGPFVYNLSTTVSDVVIPASVPVPTVGALGLGLMSLLVAGFAGFAQRRRLGK
jgi:hypothetical protein